MNELDKYLGGGDLRSIGKVGHLVPIIQNQSDFDKLFKYLHSEDRLVIMRAVDAIEKITADKPELLAKHKKDILRFIKTAIDKEFKWHLALLVSRLELSPNELSGVWDILSKWAMNDKESKIVRVNSVQSLSDLTNSHTELKVAFQSISEKIKSENIPSVNARLKNIEKKWMKL